MSFPSSLFKTCKKFKIILTFLLITFLAVSSIILVKIKEFYTISVENTSEHDFLQVIHSIHDPNFDNQNYQIFMQISDLHFSIFPSSYWKASKLPEKPNTGDSTREEDFHDFLKYLQAHIQPKVLLLTGDLVHATGDDNKISSQYPKEWETYAQILKSSGALDNPNLKILDSIGNHDSFNEPVRHIKNSSYAEFGPLNFTKNNFYSFQKSNFTYNFIKAKSDNFPGLKKPYNFIGNVDPDFYQLQPKTDAQTFNFYYGHFPTSCMLESNKFRDHLFQHGTAYFSGHLHTGYSKIPEMWLVDRQQADISSGYQTYLEAEVGDWKDYRVFRIFIIDNGQMTFQDFTYHNLQQIQSDFLVVPSNPKDAAQYLPDGKEAIFSSDFEKTRFFVFSQPKIDSVKILDQSCDISYLPVVNCPKIKGSFQLTINGKILPRIYNNDRTQSQPLLRPRKSPWAKIILLSYIETFGPVGFYLVTYLFASILFLPNLVTKFIPCECIYKFFNSFYYPKLFNSNRIIKNFTIYWLILATVGPWHIVPILQDNLGLVFPFGIYFSAKFEENREYFYKFEPSIFIAATKTLVYFWIPYTIGLPFILYYKWKFDESSLKVDYEIIDDTSSSTQIDALPQKLNKRKLLFKILATAYCLVGLKKSIDRILEFSKFFGALSQITNLIIPFHSGGLIFGYLIYFILNENCKVTLTR